MTRIVAEFSDFETMRRALNAGREFREISFKEMDEIGGMPDGYFSKVLAPGGSRRVTMDSLGTAFGAIGMKCILIEDEAAWNRIKNRIGKRANGLVRGGVVHFSISHRALKKLASKGGKARAAKLVAKRRQAIARKAGRIGNLIRWGGLTAPAEIGAEGAQRAKAQRSAESPRRPRSAGTGAAKGRARQQSPCPPA